MERIRQRGNSSLLFQLAQQTIDEPLNKETTLRRRMLGFIDLASSVTSKGKPDGYRLESCFKR